MRKSIWHGILIDKAFVDPAFPETFVLFAKEKDDPIDWNLYGVEVAGDELEAQILRIQAATRNDKIFYSHLYDDQELIVIFKRKIFRVGCNSSTWGPVVDFGAALGIPAEQLDFWPNRVQDERHYFRPESFIKERGKV